MKKTTMVGIIGAVVTAGAFAVGVLAKGKGSESEYATLVPEMSVNGVDENTEYVEESFEEVEA